MKEDSSKFSFLEQVAPSETFTMESGLVISSLPVVNEITVFMLFIVAGSFKCFASLQCLFRA